MGSHMGSYMWAEESRCNQFCRVPEVQESSPQWPAAAAAIARFIGATSELGFGARPVLSGHRLWADRASLAKRIESNKD